MSADTVWFRWLAPSSGVVTFTAPSALPMAIDTYTGSALGHLRAVSSADLTSKTSWRITQGVQYSIRITGAFSSTFALKWATSNAPANDLRTAPVSIGGSSGSLVGDTTAATADPTDPKIDTTVVPASTWYRWTAPATGSYDFDTNGSLVSTMLGVYTDADPSQSIIDSSGECSNFYDVATASVRFAATAGSSYLLMVGGTNDGEQTAASIGGPVQLNWRQAPNAAVASGNDAFASPNHIVGTNGSIAGTTDGATVETGEPAHDGIPARSSVWFSWTPTVTADYVLTALPDDSDACGAGLSVYTGTSLGTLRAVNSSNADSLMSASLASTGGAGVDLSSNAYGMQVHLFAGTTYRIAADGQADPGAFTLRWDIPQAAPILRSVTTGNGSIGVIWSPPKPTAGSARTGYLVTVLTDSLDFDTPDDQVLPVTNAFTTIRGLHNGETYRVLVAAINGAGPGQPAVSGFVTPKK